MQPSFSYTTAQILVYPGGGVGVGRVGIYTLLRRNGENLRYGVTKVHFNSHQLPIDTPRSKRDDFATCFHLHRIANSLKFYGEEDYYYKRPLYGFKGASVARLRPASGFPQDPTHHRNLSFFMRARTPSSLPPAAKGPRRGRLGAVLELARARPSPARARPRPLRRVKVRWKETSPRECFSRFKPADTFFWSKAVVYPAAETYFLTKISRRGVERTESLPS